MISYVVHDCHLINRAIVLSLWLLCGMLMVGYRMRIWTERLLGILGLTYSKVCRNILQLNGIRYWLIDFFTLSWSAQRIGGGYCSSRLLLNLLCWKSNALWRWGLCGRSFIEVENRLYNLVNLGVTAFCLSRFLICRNNYSIGIRHNLSTETRLWLFNDLRSWWSDHLL